MQRAPRVVSTKRCQSLFPPPPPQKKIYSFWQMIQYWHTVEPQFNEVPRDWEICSLYRGFVISNTSIKRIFEKTTKMFVISRTSLYRGSLNRSSTVVVRFLIRFRKEQTTVRAIKSDKYFQRKDGLCASFSHVCRQP